MKDHPHLRGAAESYNSLAEGLSAAALFVKDDGAITARLRSKVALHVLSALQDKDNTDLSFTCKPFPS